jgi:predicted nucleic acid-binding protein
MTKTQEIKKNNTKSRFTNTSKDLVILAFIAIVIFVLSYFFDIFIFLVEFFKKHPDAITWVDEIITALLTLSIGFAVFSWRRWFELRKETAERMRLQEELLRIAETKAETERIICKQLHCDIAEYKKIEKDILFRRSKVKEQFKQK